MCIILTVYLKWFILNVQKNARFFRAAHMCVICLVSISNLQIKLTFWILLLCYIFEKILFFKRKLNFENFRKISTWLAFSSYGKNLTYAQNFAKTRTDNQKEYITNIFRAMNFLNKMFFKVKFFILRRIWVS